MLNFWQFDLFSKLSHVVSKLHTLSQGLLLVWQMHNKQKLNVLFEKTKKEKRRAVLKIDIFCSQFLEEESPRKSDAWPKVGGRRWIIKPWKGIKMRKLISGRRILCMWWFNGINVISPPQIKIDISVWLALVWSWFDLVATPQSLGLVSNGPNPAETVVK